MAEREIDGKRPKLFFFFRKGKRLKLEKGEIDFIYIYIILLCS